MPGNPDAPSAPIDDITSELSDGLECCKAIMRDYRAKMAAQPSDPVPNAAPTESETQSA